MAIENLFGNLHILPSQYHGYWWPAKPRGQGIQPWNQSSHPVKSLVSASEGLWCSYHSYYFYTFQFDNNNYKS